MDACNNKSIGGEDTFTLSYMNFDEVQYDRFLSDKIASVSQSLKSHLDRMDIETIHIVPSKSIHFRHRCKFTIIHSCDETPELDNISYAMWDGGSPSVKVENFPIASKSIFEVMPVLLAFAQQHNELKIGFRGIHFLSTLTGEVIATLIYDRPIEETIWKLVGKALEEELLHQCLPSSVVTIITIIGRSKGIKVNCGDGTGIVHERFELLDGRHVEYCQKEDGFSNPNAEVNLRALDWICGCVRIAATKLVDMNSTSAATATSSSSWLSLSSVVTIPAPVDDVDIMARNHDDCSHNGSLSGTVSTPTGPPPSTAIEINILELYCGNGNHTVAISGSNLICFI